ncbi:uroporphyrin-III C- methyltransferase [Legionella nautarum]|uniref:Uroporphyrin-III C-methyltransferase n=1 Tax=Legionella nautarum TaxID=45070 RepID=A0A0W0WS75_9GAMM|nr:DUF488 family protein [Legionella nautarum]KTD35176.1 uroporphyrin-III C- methyltransferase [Legionella nautarum]
MTSSRQEAIQICRVYTLPPKKKGVWILVDRLWPRGLKKVNFAVDLWLKDISPSTILRQWFHENPRERWQEFTDRYIEELKNKDSLIKQIEDRAQHTPVTLFYAAKDPVHNHAIILQEVLKSWPNSPNLESLR